jgi:hypothetical protein
LTASTQNKKFNNNPTPPRTAVERAMSSILPLEHPKTPPRLLTLEKSPVDETTEDPRLVNNPYKKLADGDDEDETLNLVEDNEQKSRDNEIFNTSGNGQDDEEPIINDQEKIILSRKAQQALRKLKVAKRALLDSTIRAELEEVYGKVESFSPLKTQEETNDNEDVIMTSTDDEKLPGEDSHISSNSTKGPPASNKPLAINPNAQEKPLQDSTQKSSAASQPCRTVSFANAVLGPTNSNNPRRGNTATNSTNTPTNPYLKNADEGTTHAHRLVNPTKLDKPITLKKNNNRPHIHRYTVRFKTIKSKSEDEAHQLIQDCLQRFLDIVLQADPKTIIPPYLELDRNDKSVSDISSAFPVTALESYHSIKKYFFRLSPRDEEGISWCSIILAQSLSFSQFIDKAK